MCTPKANIVLTGLLQRLGRFLDRPQFPWKRLIVGFSLAQYIFEGYLSLRQYKVLQQTKPPKSLEGEVSQDVFDKSQVSSQTLVLSARTDTILF